MSAVQNWSQQVNIWMKSVLMPIVGVGSNVHAILNSIYTTKFV